jgi:rhodanese-related sulfurtransferase
LIYNKQGGNNASLGLNKQTYNMARLKVKQISDFTSAVEGLIAGQGSDVTALQNSVDSLESIDSLISAELAAEILATGNEITALQAVDSTQSTDIAANASAISSNDGDITALQNSVDSLESIDSLISAALVAEIAATDKEILDLQAVDSTQSTAIAAILDGASTDLDQFAEVVAYVNSVSSTGDLDLTSFIATSNANDSTHSTAIVGLLSDVDALEAVDSTQSTAIAANASAIGANDGDIKTLQDLMAVNDADNVVLHTESSVQSTAIAANLSAIGVINGSVDSLESIDSLLSAEIAALAADANEYLHQMWDVATLADGEEGVQTFRVPLPVEFAASDDLLVFVNGHNIHPEFTFEKDGGIEGWSTANGQTFKVTNIGYALDADDHVYVVGKKA